MITYKQYQEDHEGKMPPLLNGIVSKSISNLNEQDRQLLFPGMAADMEKEFQQTKGGQDIQRIFVKIQDGVAKEIDRLIDNLKDHLHTVVHPAQVAYGQSFDTGIGVDGRLRQAMKDTYKDMGQPSDSIEELGAVKRKARIKVPDMRHVENYQITLKQYNEFKRTLDSLDEIFLLEVGPIDWAKSKIGAGLDKVAPGVKDKLKGWWQNVWHGKDNPLNPQNLQKWDVALDDILDTFSTQLKGRVKGIISQQFDPSKGLISKHIQNLAKSYHKDTGSSSAKPSESPSEAPEAPEASSATSSKDSGEEAPEATKDSPAHGTGTAVMKPTVSEPKRIFTKGGKLNKWFKDNILSDFRTDGGIDSDRLKARLEKDGYDSDVIEKAIELTGTNKDWDLSIPKSSDEESKLQAPKISADKSKNAADRVMAAIPKGAFSKEDVENYLNGGMTEKDIIELGIQMGGEDHGHDFSTEGYIPTKKDIKSLEEYLREAKGDGKVLEQADVSRAGFDPASGKPTEEKPAPKLINDDQAVKKLLALMDEYGGIEWRHKTFFDAETNKQFENPAEIMDEDLNLWADAVIKNWKRQKKITKLSEQDVVNIAYWILDDMGLNVPDEGAEEYNWFHKRHKEKSLDQIQKIE